MEFRKRGKKNNKNILLTKNYGRSLLSKGEWKVLTFCREMMDSRKRNSRSIHDFLILFIFDIIFPIDKKKNFYLQRKKEFFYFSYLRRFFFPDHFSYICLKFDIVVKTLNIKENNIINKIIEIANVNIKITRRKTTAR